MTSTNTGGVQLTPVDVRAVQSPSSQVHLVDRAYKDCFFKINFFFNEDKYHKSGELATFLKDHIANKGGVEIKRFEGFVFGRVAKKGIALAFHGPSQKYADFNHTAMAINSCLYVVNNNTVDTRFELDIKLKKGLGMQIQPPDPGHQALHVTLSVEEGFVGFMELFVYYDCDVIYDEIEGF